MQLVSTLAHEIMCEPYQSKHQMRAIFDYSNRSYTLNRKLTKQAVKMPWAEWVSKGHMNDYIEFFREK